MKKLLSIGVVFFVMAAFSTALASNNCVEGEDFCISTVDAHKMLLADQDNAEPTVFILDVRTPEEWKWVGYPGINKKGEGEELAGRVIKIDYNGGTTFIAEIDDENLPKDATFITMCRSGHRSHLAAQDLIEAGYNAYSMNDGFEGDKDKRGYRHVNGWKMHQYSYRY